MHNGLLQVDGADLYYEVRGSGPALLMISGAGGDAGFYEDASKELADAFTVITYDRRGNSRSTGRVSVPMTFAQQASDARALIDALAGGRSLVCGCSAGASIALTLAAQHPEVVAGLIAHEPPAVSVLPDADHWQSFFASITELYKKDGAMAAVMQFVQTVRGEGSYEWPEELMQRFMGNVEHIFAVEWNAIGSFVPDEPALKAATFPIMLAAGAESRGAYYARTAAVIAQRIGASWGEFPGIHLESVARPAMFAAAVRVVATEMHSRAAGIPEQWMADPV